MRYEIERRNVALVVRFYDMLDSDEAPEIREALKQYFGEGGRQVVLDLTNVELVTTPGLGLLVSMRKRASEVDAEIALAGLKPYIKEIFDLTRLSRVFTMVETAEEAFKK